MTEKEYIEREAAIERIHLVDKQRKEDEGK